jgi:hypothetical protein
VIRCPWPFAACQLTLIVPSLLDDAVTWVGALGTALDGVALTAVDAALVPTELDAATVNAYFVPLVSPFTVNGLDRTTLVPLDPLPETTFHTTG